MRDFPSVESAGTAYAFMLWSWRESNPRYLQSKQIVCLSCKPTPVSPKVIVSKTTKVMY